ATNPGENRGRRITAARRAVALAGGFGATDTRLAYSHYVLGRLSLSRNPDQALGNFLAAGKIYQNRPDTAIHEAHVAMQIAAFQLSAGRAEVALGLVNRNLEVVTQSEHAALLSLLLLIKAEALAILDRPIQSAEAQNDALAWARYGFGNEADIRARVSEIRAISPRTRQDNPT
ncbi:MAG: ATP-dependent transcriptional regulator, partial [Boseongicola sp.]|nr:ATP-dependent transcriptional regulator [Boseongicola sp.]